MATGNVTLTISGLPSLVLSPERSSSRFAPTRIVMGEPTAYGFSTLQGISERHRTFTWRLDLALKVRDLIRLEEIIDLQQSRLATRSPNALISLVDECYLTTLGAIAKPGRVAVGSAIVQDGISGQFCAFNAIVDALGESYAKVMDFTPDYLMLDTQKVSVVLRES